MSLKMLLKIVGIALTFSYSIACTDSTPHSPSARSNVDSSSKSETADQEIEPDLPFTPEELEEAEIQSAAEDSRSKAISQLCEGFEESGWLEEKKADATVIPTNSNGKVVSWEDQLKECGRFFGTIDLGDDT